MPIGVQDLVSYLENASSIHDVTLLEKFINENSGITSIPELSALSTKQRFSSALFNHIANPSADENILNRLLQAVKILSRDVKGLQTVVSDDKLKILVERAKLTDGTSGECVKPSSVEAVKCLYNLIINCNETAYTLCKFGISQGLMTRVKTNNYRCEDAKLFDLKLLFLITAISKSMNVDLLREFNCLQLFIDLLNSELSPQDESKLSSFNISSERLKILFNVLASANLEEDSDPFSKDQIKNLVILLRDILCVNDESHSTLHSDAINLLTLVPINNLIEIEVPSPVDKPNVTLGDPRYVAISRMLDFLDELLSSAKTPRNEATPVILVLYRLCKAKKEFRKYIRLRILPKLTRKEVFTRPEDGDSLRNKLCRLLTSINSEFVADFLFLLCKENARKMVKYFGYGHAAGLFARRGLMGLTAEDTSDSESESEDYTQLKHLINPVVGCHTPSHHDPTEQMTEEQKEYLAMELVNNIDKLQRGGVLQPCKIGEDGKPQPIQHVLELQTPSENDSDTEN